MRIAVPITDSSPAFLGDRLATAVSNGVSSVILNRCEAILDPPEVATKMHWDEAEGKLILNEAVIRQIRNRGKGTRIIEIIRCFQDRGWPRAIDDLGLRWTSDQIHERLRSLNEGLAQIEFRQNGTGTGVAWGWK